MRKLWSPEAGVFLFFWLLLLISGRDQLFGDPGSLWHIVVGEKILQQEELIRTDPFSFTRGGSYWLAQWWLAECALALLARLGGLDTVLLATATLLAALQAWLYHRFLRSGMHPLLALLMVALAFLGIAYHLHPRPHLVTIVLVGWTCAALCDFEAGRIPLGRLFWLVPLYVFWANVHGGMLGGVACLAACGLGWCLTPFIGGPKALRGGQYFLFAALVVLCALTALATPYGMELPGVWLSLMSSPVLPRLIQEHGPLQTAGNVAWVVYLLAAIYLVALFGVPPSRWRVSWLLPLAFLALTWTRIRYGPLFAVTSAVALADAYPSFRWTDWLARKGSVVFRPRLPAPRPSWLSLLAPALLVAASAAFQTAAVPVPVLGAGWVRLDPSQLPVGLLPELREYERGHPEGMPIFNDMLFGGFLMYYTPGLRVFIDDRCELYGDEGLLAYAHAYFDDPGQIDRWQEQYHFDAALVQTGSSFDRYLRDSGTWTVVGQAGPATLLRLTKKMNPPSSTAPPPGPPP
jgi:hypothetical protein